jgi:hypothetical protein
MGKPENQYAEVLRLAKELVKAEDDSLKAAEARRVAPLGASRARTTTLEARWSRAAEHRARVAHQLHVAVVRAGLAERFPDSYYGEHTTGHKWYPITVVRERP